MNEMEAPKSQEYDQLEELRQSVMDLAYSEYESQPSDLGANETSKYEQDTNETGHFKAPALLTL